MQPILEVISGIICSSLWSSTLAPPHYPSSLQRTLPTLTRSSWCRVGNTGIKCKFEADGDAPSVAGHFRIRDILIFQYLQTNCREGQKKHASETVMQTDTRVGLTASQPACKFRNWEDHHVRQQRGNPAFPDPKCSWKVLNLQSHFQEIICSWFFRD